MFDPNAVSKTMSFFICVSFDLQVKSATKLELCFCTSIQSTTLRSLL